MTKTFKAAYLTDSIHDLEIAEELKDKEEKLKKFIERFG